MISLQGNHDGAMELLVYVAESKLHIFHLAPVAVHILVKVSHQHCIEFLPPPLGLRGSKLKLQNFEAFELYVLDLLIDVSIVPFPHDIFVIV